MAGDAMSYDVGEANLLPAKVGIDFRTVTDGFMVKVGVLLGAVEITITVTPLM
jgi:hypothetical protein